MRTKADYLWFIIFITVLLLILYLVVANIYGYDLSRSFEYIESFKLTEEPIFDLAGNGG